MSTTTLRTRSVDSSASGLACDTDHWSLFIPLPDLRPRFSRAKKKLVNQSPWLTLNDRDSWHRRKALTTYFRTKAVEVAEAANLPKNLRVVHILAWVSYGSNRILDPHNYMLTAKAVVDGLRDYGLIPDDNSKYLVGPDMRRDESLPRGLTLFVSDWGSEVD